MARKRADAGEGDPVEVGRLSECPPPDLAPSRYADLRKVWGRAKEELDGVMKNDVSAFNRVVREKVSRRWCCRIAAA